MNKKIHEWCTYLDMGLHHKRIFHIAGLQMTKHQIYWRTFHGWWLQEHTTYMVSFDQQTSKLAPVKQNQPHILKANFKNEFFYRCFWIAGRESSPLRFEPGQSRPLYRCCWLQLEHFGLPGLCGCCSVPQGTPSHQPPGSPFLLVSELPVPAPPHLWRENLRNHVCLLQDSVQQSLSGKVCISVQCWGKFTFEIYCITILCYSAKKVTNTEGAFICIQW